MKHPEERNRWMDIPVPYLHAAHAEFFYQQLYSNGLRMRMFDLHSDSQ